MTAELNHELHMDERVQWLLERDTNKPMVGQVRMQVLTVRRDQSECVFVSELGPSLSFPHARPLNFPCYGEYSVGEALEIAHRLRENRPPEGEEASDIIGGWQKELEELELLRKHKSISGPAVTIQRS